MEKVVIDLVFFTVKYTMQSAIIRVEYILVRSEDPCCYGWNSVK